MRRIVCLVLCATLLGLASCGDDDDTTDSTTTSESSTTTTTAGTTSSSSSSSTSTSVPAENGELLVYFAWNEKVGTAGRTGAAGDLTAALDALLAGPDEFETEIGMGTEIPPGTELLGVEVTDGHAVVDLSGDFQSGGGSLSMSVRVAQVVFTVTQFDDVDDVTVHLDGEPVDFIGGEGIQAQDLTRVDFASETPNVLVESPVPGQTVTSPLVVRGMSNTFEATVVYDITDGEGLIVADGFTTASDGNGTFGTFEFTAEFEIERAGFGAVIVFQESAETGEPVDVYEVPVRVG